ncbi:MAG: hypothetical protein ABW061_26640 [Polyangiaceae bacterium]
MSPQFVIDTERLFNVLIVIVIASFLIERALALVFENKWLVDRLSNRGLKEPIAFAVSLAVCKHWNFDAISVLFGKPTNQLWGYVVTGAIIAGGSKASLVLFHNVIGAMSNAEAERQSGKPRGVRGAEPTPRVQ